jgi:hypothetical protein
MVVDEKYISSLNGKFCYSCDDLVKPHQRWHAYEFDTMFNKPNNWRIATDDDISNYLSRYLIISHKVGEYKVRVLDNCLAIEGFDCTIYLEANELVDLKRIIDKRVG